MAALNIQLGKLTYDPNQRIAYLRMQFTEDDGQTVQGFSGLHPTKVGSMQVNCHASMADFEKYAALFSKIITSVLVDDEWKYREQSGLSGAIGSFADLSSSAVTGALGALAAVLVVRFLRRPKRVAKSAYPVA